MPNPNHSMYKSGGVTVIEDLEEDELRLYEDGDGYLRVRLASDLSKFIRGLLTKIEMSNMVTTQLEALLPDSLNRTMAERIQLLLDRAKREADLGVRLRQKLEEVAGPEVASSVE